MTGESILSTLSLESKTNARLLSVVWNVKYEINITTDRLMILPPKHHAAEHANGTKWRLNLYICVDKTPSDLNKTVVSHQCKSLHDKRTCSSDPSLVR